MIVYFTLLFICLLFNYCAGELNARYDGDLE
jgi:hypothetical protein